jgi:hypothetical protein
MRNQVKSAMANGSQGGEARLSCKSLRSYLPKLAARVSSVFLGAWMAMGAADFALAQEACVRCDEPFAIYRCQVESPDLVPNSPVQFMCITELAKRFGHRTCAVSRDTGSNCAGELVVIAPPDGVPVAPPPNLAAKPVPPDAPGAAAAEDPQAGETPPPEDPAEVAEPSEGSPETVEELAKQTVKASEKGIEKAGKTVVDAAKTTGKTIEKTGEAIGSAAKKTWRCLSSMFGDC